MHMRILFTGGGTGGHIYPIVSVAEHILLHSQTTVRFDYIGVPGPYEQLLASRSIAVRKIASAKLRQGDLVRNILDVPFFFISLVQALWSVFWIMPDVLFSKGGPGALPVVLACAFYHIPIIIHESDSVAGRTNRISGRYAKRIGIAFATAKESFLSGIANETQHGIVEQKIALVGNPIRDFLLHTPDSTNQANEKKILGFDAGKPLLLIVGGSQGSVRINNFFLSIAEELLTRNIQILHQVGVNNFVGAQAELHTFMQKYSTAYHNAYRIVPYFEADIREAYIAADVVISRAGSGSIFEIAVMGKPSILIPLPESAQDHQVKNAYEYASTGAAITMEETNLTKHIFFTQLDKLLADASARASMSAAAKAFARPDAAEVLALEILRLGQRG